MQAYLAYLCLHFILLITIPSPALLFFLVRVHQILLSIFLVLYRLHMRLQVSCTVQNKSILEVSYIKAED